MSTSTAQSRIGSAGAAGGGEIDNASSPGGGNTISSSTSASSPGSGSGNTTSSDPTASSPGRGRGSGSGNTTSSDPTASSSGSGSGSGNTTSSAPSSATSEQDDSLYDISVANLLKQDNVFDELTDFPDWWLVGTPDHYLFPVGGDVAAAAIAATGRTHLRPGDIRNTHWIKAASADRLRKALASSESKVQEDLLHEPLFVYLMPWTPLADARAIYDMGLGLMPLPATTEMVIHNQADCDNKVAAYNAAKGLRDEIEGARVALEGRRLGLDAIMEINRKRAAELAAEYHQHKERYLGATEDGGGNIANSKHFHHGMMLKASARIVVVQRAADLLQEASAHLATLGESLTKKVAQLDEAMRRPTFMGCGDGSGACDLGMVTSTSSSPWP